jgi:hypothetical protein
MKYLYQSPPFLVYKRICRTQDSRVPGIFRLVVKLALSETRYASHFFASAGAEWTLPN